MHRSVYDACLFYLPKIRNRAGNITPVHNNLEIPFSVRRIFYLYDIPGGESRGAHAHKECHQFLIAASGSFEVLLDDGTAKRQIMLNRPDIGLHIPPGIWASEMNFSSGAICLALASHVYDGLDYIRSYDEYQAYLFSVNANIRLVTFDETYLEKSWEWLNDEEIREATMTPRLSREVQLKWYESLPTRTGYHIWGVQLNDTPIGVFGIKNINGFEGEYWGYIGRKDYQNRGIGRYVIKKIMDIAIRELNIKTLNLVVSAHNTRALRVYEKCGFYVVSEKDGIIYMSCMLSDIDYIG